MSQRLATPDTQADITLREVLDAEPRRGFVVVAGAGSGKTTSLVKALGHVVTEHGEALRTRTQQIACITYTEIAAREIHEDVGESELAHVSTIHSFLWRVVKPFQADIGAWVENRVKEKLQKAAEERDGFTSRTREAKRIDTDDKIARYTRQLEELPAVSRFTYGVGSSYGNGVLGHADVLAMVPELIMSRPLLARLIGSKFQYVFVDESQDTFPAVVECLKHVERQAKGRVCLGFFRDPMQQIYPTGIGHIALEDGWEEIEKPENFRSAERVLEVVNRVRESADGLQQVSGLPDAEKREGATWFFVLPADDNRNHNLERVRAWLTENGAAGDWTREAEDGGAKILMTIHRMAARRLGFPDLFEAFNKSPLSEAFDEGSAWPLAPFKNVILPLSDGRGSPVSTLRASSQVLSEASVASTSVLDALAASRAGLAALDEIMSAAGPGSIGTALKSAAESGLIDPDPRLGAYLALGDASEVELSDDVRATLDAYMECDVAELPGYFEYVEQRSPYSTQHGTKGAEFLRVLVVLDDEEGRFPLYSYEKFIGLEPLSSTDKGNIEAGKDSVLDRTRRLFYVCVSRATDALAIVLFAGDVSGAVASLSDSGLPGDDPVLTLDSIS